ncbi:MAG: hypothetical protein Kow0089_14990 [Desulfobulbaceae bacterium]
MKENNSLKVTAALAIMLLMPITASAKKGNREGRHPGPPPEAIEACEGKKVGDSVKFTGRRGETLETTCQEIDGQLVAAPPEGMRPGGGRSD